MPEIEPTCGQGLAEQSALPARLGEVIAAMADVLELHMTTLDLEDEGGQQEYAAYLKLTEAHRETAARLRASGEQMEGYRDLPMAKHDQDVMRSAPLAEAFARFVRVEQELLELLQQRVEQDRAML
jgi:hypothetical protein